MKFVLSMIVILSSVLAMADIPRPRPPGPVDEVDVEALNVLVYGTTADKLAQLKQGTNHIKASVNYLSPGLSRYTFTAQKCSYGIAGFLCLGGNQMTVERAEKVGPDRATVKYKASDVRKIR